MGDRLELIRATGVQQGLFSAPRQTPDSEADSSAAASHNVSMTVHPFRIYDLWNQDVRPKSLCSHSC